MRFLSLVGAWCIRAALALIVVCVAGWYLVRAAAGNEAVAAFARRARAAFEAAAADGYAREAVAVVGPGGLRSEGPAAPRIAALRSDDGVLRKVLIVQRGILPRRTPGGEPAATEPLGFFAHLFVFGEHRNHPGARAFEVGHDPISPVGWVDASAVREWDTRLGLRVQADVVVFETAEEAERASRGERVSPFAVGRAALIRTGDRPLPIVGSRQVRAPNGHSAMLAQLLFVGSDPAPAAVKPAGASAASGPAASDDQIERERKEIAEVEVRFVIDYTGSMKPVIDTVREQVGQTARALVRDVGNQARLTFSGVAYRDYSNEDPWAVRWLGTASASEVESFERMLLSESAEGGGDVPEAVYDGIEAGLTRPWNNHSTLGLRLAVVVGQTSAHESGPGNPRALTGAQLVKLAEDQNVQVLAPCSADESAKLRAQLEAICGLRGGQIFQLADAEAAREVIHKSIMAQAAKADARAKVADGLIAGKSLPEIAAAHRLADGEVQAAFEFLRDSTNILRRRLADGEADPGSAVAIGWVIWARGDALAGEPHVMVHRDELGLLISELMGLVAVTGRPELLRQVQTGTGALHSSGWLGARTDETLAGFLKTSGVFVHEASILHLTQDQLLTMPEERRRQLREQLDRRTIPGLIEVQQSDRWDAAGFGFVPQRLFP